MSAIRPGATRAPAPSPCAILRPSGATCPRASRNSPRRLSPSNPASPSRCCGRLKIPSASASIRPLEKSGRAAPRRVSPSATTTYTLTVHGPKDQVITQTVTVTVAGTVAANVAPAVRRPPSVRNPAHARWQTESDRCLQFRRRWNARGTRAHHRHAQARSREVQGGARPHRRGRLCRLHAHRSAARLLCSVSMGDRARAR